MDKIYFDFVYSLQLASSSLLTLGHDNEKLVPNKARESLYLLLDQVRDVQAVQRSPVTYSSGNLVI